MLENAELEKQNALLGIDFVFEMGLRKVDEQMRIIQDMDLKMGILIGFLGAFAAALVGFFFTTEGEKLQHLLSGSTLVLFLLSLLLLGLALIRCFQAFKIREYFAAFYYPRMVEWAHEEPRKIKNAFMADVLEAVEQNRREIARKRNYAKQGMGLILLTVVFLLLVLLSLIWHYRTVAGG